MVMKAEVKMSAAGANEQLLQKCANKKKKKQRHGVCTEPFS